MRQLLRFLFTVLCVVGVFGSAFAIGPGDLTDLTNPLVLAPLDLAKELCLNAGPASVVTGSIVFNGSPFAAGTFKNANVDGIGSAGVVQTGVILTTGDIHSAVGPNVSGQVGTSNAPAPGVYLAGDASLDGLIAPDTTKDATVLEFDFIPSKELVTFQFVFASDEYTELDPANDVFGLFIDGLNIAVVPGTANPVSVFNINATLTPTLFFNNDVDVMVPPYGTQYDGFTSVMTASAILAPGVAHHVKFAIADAGVDDTLDSAVFIAPATFNVLTPTIQSLITSYYNTILNRAPDSAGFNFWTNNISGVVALGIDISEGFQGLARFFFDSNEYALRARDDTQFVTDLYQTFLQRAPDAPGLANWLNQLGLGLTRDMLITQFANSPEFKLFLQGVFANIVSRPENNLVNDFYRGLLNRSPDAAGFNSWLTQMKAAQCGGALAVQTVSNQISQAFIASQEYTLRARNNSQYVEDLYNAILRRGADPGGFAFWINALATQTRAQVLQAFTGSPEFQLRVQQVINAGCLP